jgi:putative peptidoglycan lipid II flippase
MDDDLTLSEDLQQQDKQSDSQAGKQMGIAAVIITAFLMVGRVMGIGKEVVLASLGAGAHTDAYKIAYNSVIYTIYTKVEKLMRPTYLPEFVKVRREEGEEAAWEVASVMTGFQFLLLVGLAVLVVVFAEPLLLLVGTGLANSPDDLHRGVVMLRIMAPALVLFSLSVMPELTLHAYKKFTLPAVAEAAFRTALVAVFVILVGVMWPGKPKDAVYAAAWAVLVGGSLRLLTQLPGLWGKLRMFRLTANIARNPSARTIIRLMPPVVLGLVFATIRTWADSRFSSVIEPGMYTCLDFARKIPDVLLQTLALAVSFVVYPFLSEWALRGEKDKMADALVATTRAMAFVFVPLGALLMIASLPMIQLMYQHGQFTAAQADLSALGVYWYSPGLFFYSLDAPINHWYFALKDTATPNLMGVVFVIVHVVISYLGVYRIGQTPRQQLAWVAAALTISKSGKIIALYAMIRPRIGRIDRAAVASFCAKLAVCTGAMVAAVLLVQQRVSPALEVWQPPVGGVKVQALVELALSFGVATVVLLAVAALLRVEELSIVGRLAGKAVGKVRGKLGGGRGK